VVFYALALRVGFLVTKGDVRQFLVQFAHPRSRFSNSQPLGHLFIEEAFTRAVGLEPFTIDDKLRNGAPTSALYHFFSSARRGFDVDFFVCNVMPLQEAFCLAAVGAPEGGIKDNLHLTGYLTVNRKASQS